MAAGVQQPPAQSDTNALLVLSHLVPLSLPPDLSQGLCEYTAVGVDAAGLVSPADVVAALTPNTVLVSIMHSNNEVGTIQPIGAITSAVKAVNPDVLVHTDAAQSMGRVDVDVQVGVGVRGREGWAAGSCCWGGA